MIQLFLSFTIQIVLPVVVSLRYTSCTRNGKKILENLPIPLKNRFIYIVMDQ